MFLNNNKNILVGDPRLDLEHQQILSTLERLQEPIVSKTLRIATCEKLLHYINQHVVDEEAIMRLYNVPNMEEHFQEHINLQEHFISLLGTFIKNGGSINYKVKEAFIHHIEIYDINMIGHIRKQKELDANNIEMGF